MEGSRPEIWVDLLDCLLKIFRGQFEVAVKFFIFRFQRIQLCINLPYTLALSNKISDTYLSAMVLRGDMKKDYEKIQRYIYAYLAEDDAEEKEHLLSNIDFRYFFIILHKKSLREIFYFPDMLLYNH